LFIQLEISNSTPSAAVGYKNMASRHPLPRNGGHSPRFRSKTLYELTSDCLTVLNHVNSHTLTHTHCLSLSHTQTHTHSPTHSHKHTHTHTHTHTHKYTHTNTQTHS